MPLPHHVQPIANRFRRHWLGRRAPRPSPIVLAEPAEPVRVRPRIDGHTRTFWSQGAEHTATLVEVDAAAEQPPARDRIAELVRAHESGRSDARSSRPRGNPAFSEALFVELMRGRQYSRAFAQLTAECRRSWGSPAAFAAAHAGGELRRLRGVTVKDVRYLPEWHDPERGTMHREVAELSVEYAFGDDGPVRVVPRVVHLVGDDGRWRSLCYRL